MWVRSGVVGVTAVTGVVKRPSSPARGRCHALRT